MLRIVLGTLLVLAGLSSALVTVLARRTNENTLAGAAAILSLLIALLLTIFIVPPLARSARVEVANLDFPLEPTSGGGCCFSCFHCFVRHCLWVGWRRALRCAT
jgi:Ca2+/H+ antiporter